MTLDDLYDGAIACTKKAQASIHKEPALALLAFRTAKVYFEAAIAAETSREKIRLAQVSPK